MVLKKDKRQPKITNQITWRTLDDAQKIHVNLALSMATAESITKREKKRMKQVILEEMFRKGCMHTKLRKI